ncbi:molecular chaperone IbpA [Rhodoligotrophos appendicifer]|uniref:Hsp20 family protein n=1 Tax=Rhodoligotrophos appendicifer TaxID=987056 RepID=UPI001FE76EA8|nr:Hsp20 family protein [Rhodoligotrophos appendicifer]
MYDLTPLYRSTIGFDRFGSLLESLGHLDGGNGYPPYNIERLGTDQYRISMAVAGFKPEELNVEVKESAVTISGRRNEKPAQAGSVLHQGIASRSFERRFQLADFVKVTGASLENGLLHVELTREIPEAAKPRTIAIENKAASSPEPKTIEQKAA